MPYFEMFAALKARCRQAGEGDAPTSKSQFLIICFYIIPLCFSTIPVLCQGPHSGVRLCVGSLCLCLLRLVLNQIKRLVRILPMMAMVNRNGFVVACLYIVRFVV